MLRFSPPFLFYAFQVGIARRLDQRGTMIESTVSSIGWIVEIGVSVEHFQEFNSKVKTRAIQCVIFVQDWLSVTIMVQLCTSWFLRFITPSVNKENHLSLH